MSIEKFDSSEENCNEWRKYLACALVLSLLVRPITGEYVWNSPGKGNWLRDRLPKISNPVFEDTDTRVVTMAGRDVVLPCRISNLNDKVVSWIRTRDLHILTSGPVMFTADDRFQSNHDPSSLDWSLRLKNSQPTDSGVYECQVNTDPKMNRKITLDVDVGIFGNSPSGDLDLHMVDDEGESPHKGEPLTRVLGKEEQFVKIGSTITFTCVVIVPEEPITSIDWLKNGRQVSFQASRGGIIVETEKSEKKATSRLTLADVKAEDSGNYTCKPGNAKSHSVNLVVVEGERTQAMQRHKNASRNSKAIHTGLLLFLCLLLSIQ